MGDGHRDGPGFKDAWDVLRIACIIAMGGAYVGGLGFKGAFQASPEALSILLQASPKSQSFLLLSLSSPCSSPLLAKKFHT